MVKKALTLLTSVLIALHLLMPFNIYADTITQSNIIGVNTTLISREISQGINSGYIYIYNYENEITLDNNYIGWLEGNINVIYHMSSNSDGSWNNTNITRSVRTFVNGNKVKINVSILSSINIQGVGIYVSSSYLLTSSNVTKYEDIDSITQIINILEDLYTNSNDIEGLETNQLTALQNILLSLNQTNIKLDDVNNYLDIISKLRNYNIPLESYPIVFNTLRYQVPSDLYQNGYNIEYPIFYPASNSSMSLLTMFAGTTYDFIIISRAASVSSFNQFYDLYNDSTNNKNYEISLVKMFQTLIMNHNNTSYVGYLSHFRIKVNESGNYVFKPLQNNLIYIPIYFNTVGYKYISTDFALKFGLTNKLLDDLDIIANGTVQSDNAAQSSDRANEQLTTESNTLFQQENGFKSDMQNAMQNVNNSFRLQDMGTKFVTSAQWVRTQYENLTNNTPFASLITFSLITGLALILLGKVYK